MATIEPLRNHIIFQFIEKKRSHMGVKQFEEETDWGLKFVRVDDSTQNPRWGVVTHVGPEVPAEIQPGVRVLIDKLKWTNEIQVGEEFYWRTDYDCLLAVDEDSIPTSSSETAAS